MSERLEALVFAMRHEARGVVSVELRPASADLVFPRYEAGAHIDLHLPNGLTRSYSLCELDPSAQRYVVGVLNDRASRGGSRYIHEKLRVGSSLFISPPINNFHLIEDAPRSVLLAGGIGITPIAAMIRRLHQLGRQFDVIYCSRSRDEAPFLDTVEQLTEEGHVHFHFDNEVGGPPDLRALLSSFDADTHFYCCGPTPMLNSYEVSCSELGFQYVHLERFGAPLREPLTDRTEAAFEVRACRTGGTYSIPPNKSILEVLREAGLDVDYSCEEGVCGSCETVVVEGEVDHRDCILTEDERAANKTMMICVSRSHGGILILDK